MTVRSDVLLQRYVRCPAAATCFVQIEAIALGITGYSASGGTPYGSILAGQRQFGGLDILTTTARDDGGFSIRFFLSLRTVSGTNNQRRLLASQAAADNGVSILRQVVVEDSTGTPVTFLAADAEQVTYTTGSFPQINWNWTAGGALWVPADDGETKRIILS